MRVLVTGAAGFLGSHLVERLLECGHEVVAVDNMSTGRLENLPPTNFPDFTAVNTDVRSPTLYAAGEDCEQIYHLACPASPVHYAKDPIATLNTCYLGTRTVLELARRESARVLLASTSEVYGDPREHPQRETYWGHVNSIGPRSMYDEGKRVAEALAWAFWERHSLDIRVARLFNSYGPRMALGDGRVIPAFCTAAIEGRPLPVQGDGSQTRSLCYVDDTIEGLMLLMEATPRWWRYEVDKEKEAGRQAALYRRQVAAPFPINIGSPQEITILDLAQVVSGMAGRALRIESKPAAPDDPWRRCPDISRAAEFLGWRPKVGLEEGLRRTLEWFREELATKTRTEVTG